MQHHENLASATRRQPRQRRSRLLVASIREACRRILREGSPEQLTAKRIAEVAGVTAGSFYQYYPNKEAVLLDVLLEQAPDEAERIADETRHLRALRDSSLALTLRELVDITCARHLRLLALHGEIYRRHHRHIDFEGLIRESVRRYVEVASLQNWVRELLQRHREDLDGEGLDIAAFLITGALVEMSARAVDTRPGWLADERFRAELHGLLLRYAGTGDTAHG
jgi:AcrR family transcriptional regulator